MREYQIANKVTSLMGHFKGYEMNSFLIPLGEGKVVHVIREYDSANGWHKRVISLAISTDGSTLNMAKASFGTKSHIDQLINMLVNYRDELE